MMSSSDQPHDRPRGVRREVTAAAGAFLDQYVADTKARILERSADLTPGGESEPIRLSAIRKVLQESNEIDGSRPHVVGASRRVLVVVLVVLALQGLTITITLAASRGFTEYLIFLIAGIAFGGMTAAIASGALALRRIRIKKVSRLNEDAINTFLVAMSKLEDKARQIGSRILRSSPEAPDLRSIIESIEHAGIWTQEEVRDFQQVLAIRNQVVHESFPLKSSSHLSGASVTALRLTEILIDREQGALDVFSHSSRDAMNYEHAIAIALRRTLGSAKVASLNSGYADFIVEMPMGTTLVQVKFTGKKQLYMKQVEDVVDRIDPTESAGLLIVTNAYLSNDVREFNGQNSLSQHPVEVVTWRGEENDGLLLRAIARLARKLGPSGTSSEYRFQLYATADGKFMFRVVAPNGEIIAVSEEFATRRDAAREIENLQRAASTSELDDRTGV